MDNLQAQETFITVMTFRTHPKGLVELHNRNVSGVSTPSGRTLNRFSWKCSKTLPFLNYLSQGSQTIVGLFCFSVSGRGGGGFGFQFLPYLY